MNRRDAEGAETQGERLDDEKLFGRAMELHGMMGSSWVIEKVIDRSAIPSNDHQAVLTLAFPASSASLR